MKELHRKKSHGRSKVSTRKSAVKKISIPKPVPSLRNPTSKSKPMILAYKEQYINYINKGLSQISLLMIRRIASNTEIPISLRSYPLLRKLENTVKDLLMNEIEITLFGIFLESFGWNDTEFSLDNILPYTGLLAKKELNQNIESILDYFTLIDDNFLKNYEKWGKKYKHLCSIDPVLLNSTFSIYSSVEDKNERKIIDYNYIVDEILRGSQSYNTEPSSSDLVLAEKDIFNKFFEYKSKEEAIYNDSVIKNLISKELSTGMVHTFDSPIMPTNNFQTRVEENILYPNQLLGSFCNKYFNYVYKNESNNINEEQFNYRNNLNIPQLPDFPPDTLFQTNNGAFKHEIISPKVIIRDISTNDRGFVIPFN